MASKTHELLAATRPFSFLPEAELREIESLLSTIHYFSGMTLFVQNKTQVSYFYVVLQGKLEQYILESGEKSLQRVLTQGDTYGGLSLLFNQGISLYMVQTLEDSILCCLEAGKFLELCSGYREFAAHFIDRFRDLSDEKTFLEHFARQVGRSDQMELEPARTPVSAVFSSEYLDCAAETPVLEAARMMTARNTGHILVRRESGDHAGVITDADLRSKVICGSDGYQAPASRVMSAPLISVSANEDILRAMTAMLRFDVSRLGVVDQSERLVGVITEKDILRVQMGSHLQTLHEVRSTQSVQELAFRHEQLPHLVKSLLDSGASAQYINRFITSFNELILERLMDFALRELGHPPARFAFLLMGSEGRQEQTLKTDQDNAIVYEDVSRTARDSVHQYFLELGTKVCDWLHEVGQQYCEFDIMAKNPSWCQPLSAWKKLHRRWIESDDPQTMLHANIFFDFRLGYGQEELVRDLQQSLFHQIQRWPGFLQHMARNAFQIKPPLSFFGNFILEETGQKKGGFDIKSAMRLVVDFARIYTLQEGIGETNTRRRLEAMHQAGELDRQNLEDLIHTYEYLMYQRLKHQAKNVVNRGTAPDNYILPSRLTHIEQQSLKEAFKRIRTAQGKLRLDFFLHLV
ncbi:MAG: DUF294 nucleotidyltransferase-like domain-containing protein [Desulfohalobiaceae bacterium]